MEINDQEFLWVEKYRPQTIDECILPAEIKATLKGYVEQGKIPNLLFEGPPGTGKTTAARVLCAMVGVDHVLVNSSDERGIDTLRVKITDYASTLSLMGNGKCVIMDEADNLTPDAQMAFRGMVEKFSQTCTFILTCNFAARLSEAIDSRTAKISFRYPKSEEMKLKAQMFRRLQSILNAESVSFADADVATVVDRYFPDFRKTIGELQRLSVTGKLESTTKALSLDGLMQAIREKNFSKARTWIAENSDASAIDIYRKVYDHLYDYFQPTSIPQAVLIVAKYQYQHSMVADPEVNLAAFVVELMVDTELK